MTFEFATAGRILFGAGVLGGAGAQIAEYGSRVLVVTGRNPARAQRLLELLRAAGVSATTFAIEREPALQDIEAGVAAARAADCSVVVGFGGGSAIDAAKAIAAMQTNPGTLLDYLEVVGRAQPLTRPAAPCIAIPTTAGTGAEVTRNAVLGATEHRVKVSLRSPLMLPRLAIVDPELTYSLPPRETAATGLDALTQLLEPYVSSRSNPLTDALCIEGLRRVGRSLERAVNDGSNAQAREDMAVASLFGGLALTNAGLGAVHGFAGPLGGAYPVPHGTACAVLLPTVVAMNVRALQARAPGHSALARYDELARVLTGRSHAKAADLVHWLTMLVKQLEIPRLSAYGLTGADIPRIVAAAAKASSMKANPIQLTPKECTEILEAAV